MTDGNTAPLRVLIVDDAADLRLLVRYVLKLDALFEVIGEAEDGQHGVEQAAALQPDVVLLDLSMPGMDGLEALPLIREAVADVRVVVLSGFSAKAMATPAVEAGALGYLSKGLPPGDLLEKLRAMLGVDAEVTRPAGVEPSNRR